MIFRCRHCGARYWTGAGRAECAKRHPSMSVHVAADPSALMSQYGESAVLGVIRRNRERLASIDWSSGEDGPADYVSDPLHPLNPFTQTALHAAVCDDYSRSSMGADTDQSSYGSTSDWSGGGGDSGGGGASDSWSSSE